MIAATPHDSVFGGFANSTPLPGRAPRMSFVRSSHSNDIPVNVPIRSSRLRRGEQCNPRLAPGRSNLDPALPWPHRLIRLKCKSEYSYIKVQRPVLVANGNTGEFQLSDHDSPFVLVTRCCEMDCPKYKEGVLRSEVARQYFSQVALPATILISTIGIHDTSQRRGLRRGLSFAGPRRARSTLVVVYRVSLPLSSRIQSNT